MSHEAFNWVWTTHVGDAQRKVILLALANHANKAGRHAWPSRKTIAEYAECSVKTVDRHLAKLLAEGFVIEGDQTIVQHIRGDRRPVVYDLAMDDATRAAWKTAHERGDTLTPRPEDLDDPAEPARGDNLSPREQGHGATHEATDPVPRGVTAVTPKPGSKPRTNPPSPPPAGGARRCTRHPATTPGTNCRACGTTNAALEAAARQQAAAERRAADQAAAAASRAAREQALALPPDSPGRQAFRQVGRQLAHTTRGR